VDGKNEAMVTGWATAAVDTGGVAHPLPMRTSQPFGGAIAVFSAHGTIPASAGTGLRVEQVAVEADKSGSIYGIQDNKEGVYRLAEQETTCARRFCPSGPKAIRST
jgi:hypothetical protein